MSKITFSIVICTLNRPLDLNNCLKSILLQTYPIYEVIIVDASSNKDTRLVINDFTNTTRLTFQYIHSKPGLTNQRNIGVQSSSGDVIAFLDDDVILEPDYLKVMSSVFSDSKVDGATGHIIHNFKQNKLESFFHKFFFLTDRSKKGYMKRSGFASFVDPNSADDIQPTDILSGCNMLFRKYIFDFYLFDEFFDGYSLMEDVEFSYRASKTFNFFFIKKATLSHVLSKNERIDLKKYFEMAVVNHFHVFNRNVYSSITDWPFFFWSTLGILIKCLFWCFKEKNFSSIKGFLCGHSEILKTF